MLKQAGELRLSVGDDTPTTFLAILRLGERRDDFPEHVQRLVDVDTFFGLLARSARQALLFGTCQVHQLQLRHCHVVWVPQILAFDCQTENAVRSRTEVIEVMAGQDAVASTVTVQVQHFLWCGRFKNVQILNDKLVFLRPTDSETGLPFN